MRMVNISNEKSMQSYTARCSRYKNKYTNLVCGKTAVGRNYNLPRDTMTHKKETKFYLRYTLFTPLELKNEIDSYMKPTYERKKTLFKEHLTRLCELQEYKFDVDAAYYKFERFVDDSTFNVIFSNWEPSKPEITEIFNIFCKLQFQGIPLADSSKN